MGKFSHPLENQAKNGYATGMYNLGWCYQHAYGTAANENLADYWEQKAEEAEKEDN